MRNSSRFSHYLILTVLLFAFWMALSPSIAALNIVLGIATSVIVVLITHVLLGDRLAGVISLPFLLNFPRFVLPFMWEIVKANIDVALIVINPKLPIEPRIFPYRCSLKGDLEKTVFAFCINLTPGTVVVDIQDDVFFVHGLARRHQDGLAEKTLETMVMRLFGYKTPGLNEAGVAAK